MLVTKEEEKVRFWLANQHTSRAITCLRLIHGAFMPTQRTLLFCVFILFIDALRYDNFLFGYINKCTCLVGIVKRYNVRVGVFMFGIEEG